jgi:hypothetical protein
MRGVGRGWTHAAGAVVAAADDLVAGNLDAADRVLVAGQQVDKDALLDVPDAERRIARARDHERPALEHLEAADGRGVPAEDVKAGAEADGRKAVSRYERKGC